MQPKSLCEYLGVQSLEQHLKFAIPDIKNLLIKHAIGPSGWWYLEKILDQGHVTVSTLAFSDDNQLLAVGYQSAGVNVWNAQDKVIWQKDIRMPGEMGYHPDVSFIPRSHKLAIACGSPTLDAWDLATCRGKACHQDKHPVVTLDNLIYAASFSKDCSRCVTSSGKAIDVWNAHGARVAHMPIESSITKPSISFDATLVAFAHSTLNVWNISKNTVKKYPALGNLLYTSVLFHPHKNMLVTLARCNENLNAVWDCSQKQRETPICVLPTDTNYCKQANAVMFHPQGHVFAVGYEKNGILLFNMSGDRLLRIEYERYEPCQGIHGLIDAIAFNANGTCLAAGRRAGLVPLWREYTTPTLAQVLFRGALQCYYQECIAKKKSPQFSCVLYDQVVPWMVNKMCLKQEELEPIWSSFPEYMKAVILRTLFYRSGLI